MPLFTIIITLAILLLILSALRSRLIFEFLGISVLIFGTQTIGLWLYSILFLPGTIIHELSHWLVAEILQVRTGEIKILPDLESHGKNRKLGSVATASVDPLRGFLIGIAPLIAGMTILSLMGYFLFLGNLLWWQYTLLFYGIAVIGSSMLLSSEDRKNWPFIIIFVFILSYISYQLSVNFPALLIAQMSITLISLNKILILTSLIILCLIGILLSLRRIIEKLLHKKIIRGE